MRWANAFVLFDYLLGHKSFIAGAVPTGICALINIFSQLFPNQLRPLLMAWVGSPHKPVVAYIEQRQYGFKAGADAVGELLGRNFGFGGFFGNLTTMLVSTSSK